MIKIIKSTAYMFYSNKMLAKKMKDNSKKITKGISFKERMKILDDCNMILLEMYRRGDDKDRRTIRKTIKEEIERLTT